MSDSPSASRSGHSWTLTAYVGGVAVSAVFLAASLLRTYPPAPLTPNVLLGLFFAGIVLHVLNQLNFTIRFMGQPDNVELTFSEAALVALFFVFGPGPVTIVSGIVHFIREIQAHRRRRIQVVFNTSEIIFCLALAGFVYQGIQQRFGGAYIVAAIICAMLTHSIINRLLVGTVISINAGRFDIGCYKSLFVENVIMLPMNLALGMAAVMALLLDRPYLLWVPVTILAVVYLAYQAYVGQLRDANTLTRLYENALLTSTQSEALLIPLALSRALDTFGSRQVSLAMAAGPETLGQWLLEQDESTPQIKRLPGSLRECEGADGPLLIATNEPAPARAWRHGAKYTGMAAPVQYEGMLMGVLRAEKPRAWDAFTNGDLRAFSLFARQLGVALENARLMELDREQQRLRQRALDAERNRISRDLHDSFVQTLVQVDLHLAYLQRLLEKRPDKVPGEIAELQENVREGLADARSYMAELKPLRIEPGEFLTVAQRYLDDFGRQYGLATCLESDGHELDLTGDDLTELFQIVREGLNNVAKHADAKHVVVRFRSTETHVLAAVEDDGKGFDPTATGDLVHQGHYGLSNICERASGMRGAVDWHSAPGQGTTLSITIPRRSPSDVLKGVAA